MVPFIGPQYCTRCLPAKEIETQEYLEPAVWELVRKAQMQGVYSQEEIDRYREGLMEEIEGHVQELREPDQEMLRSGLYNPGCY